MMKEAAVQSKIRKRLKNLGYLTLKQAITDKVGVPDLLVLGNGKARFLEVKTEKGKVSEKQKAMHSILLKCGFAVDTVFGWDDFKHLELNNYPSLAEKES